MKKTQTKKSHATVPLRNWQFMFLQFLGNGGVWHPWFQPGLNLSAFNLKFLQSVGHIAVCLIGKNFVSKAYKLKSAF